MRRWWVVIYPFANMDTLRTVIRREGFDIRVYCPTIKTSVTKRGVARIEDKPMLFNYMFWRLDLDKLSFEEIRRHVQFIPLKLAGKYRYLKVKQIDALKRRVNKENERFDRLRTDIRHMRRFVGRKVLVHDGVFCGSIGRIKGVKRPGVFNVEMMVFNRLVDCGIPVENLEIVKG